MLSKLKWNFVLINMSCVTIILIAVFTVFCTVSYHKTKTETISSMHRMAEQTIYSKPPLLPDGERQDMPKEENGDGTSPEQRSSGNNPPDGAPVRPRRDDMPNGNRRQMRIPLFCIKKNSDGTWEYERGENITVNDDLIQDAAEYVDKKNEDEGIFKDQDLRYLRINAPDGEHIIFADRSNEVSSLRNMLLTSILSIIGALAAFFAASFLLAGVALKPVRTAWEDQRRFVADASHELKTPITVILANMNILGSNRDDPIGSQMKWIENTVDEAQRMKELVEDMLFLAKGDARKNQVQLLPVDLSELIMGSTLQFEAVAFEKGVIIDETYDSGIEITGDAGQLKQLIGILLDNACKYADDNTHIKVSLKKDGSWAVLKVNNMGAVIPEEDAAHIFERFYRAEKSRVRKTGGYGLGLAIAQSITHLHSGKISVKSNKTDGTTFTVRLPLNRS